jgi:type IV pilus assembly protein PilF
MRFWLITLSALVVVGCSSLSKDKESAELHHRIGTGHLSSGNYPQALSELLEAQKLDPSSATIQNSLGLAYYFRERMDLAEEHLRKAVSLQADFSEARNNLGRVLSDEGKFAEAVVELKKVIADLTYINPERAFTNLGMTQFKMGQFDEAKKSLAKALDIQRENCLAQSYFGRCFYELKDYKRATETLDRAVGYCQRILFDEPHYYSALSYYQLGKSAKAQARLEELIKLYPDGRYSDKAKSMLETIRR